LETCQTAAVLTISTLSSTVVPPALTASTPAFFPKKCIYGFILFSEQTIFIFIKSINQLNFAMGMNCIFFSVETEFLNNYHLDELHTSEG
jgi:hypothetical protein